jgi:hypothetical protein
VKLQNAHVSTTRALPLELVVAALITCSFDALVRFEHCGHLSYWLTHFGYRNVKWCAHPGQFHTS